MTLDVSNQNDERYNLPQVKEFFAPNRAFKPVKITLNGVIDLKKKKFEGHCITQIEILNNSKLVFNANQMRVKNVKVNNKKVKFSFEKGSIEIENKKLPKKSKVEIFYELNKPKLGMFFVNGTKNNKAQMWTMSESEKARYWIPCQDQPESKASFESIISVSEENIVISNGELKSVKHNKKKKQKTFHWKLTEPNPTYLNSLAVGPFSEIKEKWKNVDITYYCEKGQEEDAKRAFSKTKKSLSFLSDYLKHNYPYKKYAQVAASKFIYGGMEHTTCTTQTDRILQDEIANKEFGWLPDLLVAHEMAHQWFGNLVTNKNWSDGWLNESFATYLEAMFTGHDKGKDEFDLEMYKNALGYFNTETKNKRAMSTNYYINPDDLFDTRIYEKGAWILHMIKFIIGEESFRDSLKNYLEKYKYSNAEGKDLAAVFRDTTGKNLTQFFEQWVYKGGNPAFKVNYHWDSKKKKAIVRIIQKQKGTIYNIPIQLQFYTSKNKKETFTEQINKNDQEFSYKLKSEPLCFVFDEENNILKTTEEVKPLEMWAFQLENSSNAVSRILAAKELSKNKNDEVLKFLENSLLKDKFWGVRSSIVRLFTKFNPNIVNTILLNAFGLEKDSRVKAAIIDSLPVILEEDHYYFLKTQMKVTNSYLIQSSAYKNLGKLKQVDILKDLQEGMKKEVWGDLIQVACCDSAVSLNTSEAIKILFEFCSEKYSARLNSHAIMHLSKIGKGNDKIRNKIAKLTNSDSVRVQVAATSALGDIGDKRDLSLLRKIVSREYEGRVIRNAAEAIRKINGGLDLLESKK